MLGSSHSYHLALHCLADLRFNNEATLAHWFLPYFMTAALRISSSVFFQTPPLIIILMVVYGTPGPAGARFNVGRLVRGGAARRAALRALGVAPQSSAARPARLGTSLVTAPRGGAASSLRRVPALRGWQKCARLSVSPEVRCVAFTAPSRWLLSLLVPLQHASSVESAETLI